MRLAELVAVSARLARTGSRSAKIDALARLLRSLAADEVGIGVRYLSGEPPQGRLGIGPAVIRSARPPSSAGEPGLELIEVDRRLDEIAATTGGGSAARRRELLGRLFAAATADEQSFLARLLLGELRQGALEGVMAEAVARAAGLSPGRVRRAAMLSGSLAATAQAALTEGEAGLARFSLQPFRPVLPMLAQPAGDVAEAIATLGEAAFDWKLDGARVQVHKRGDEVRLYTRGLNEVGAAAPEIVESVRALPVRELIADGEAIALKPDGSPHPFQTTMRRFGRRLRVDALRAELPLSVFVFDCLGLDGEALIDRPAAERFSALQSFVPRELLVPRLVSADPRAASAFFEQALARGHEGVMAKSLTAPYEAGSRGSAWLKIKRANTLDLVVLAAEWGSGRRRGWLSNLHLGARDPQGGFVMLGKTFKGMTDELLDWQTRRLLQIEVARDGPIVHVKPELVVEIACNEIQESSQYPGGLALRFARVKRYREDKRASEADTIDTVRALHAAQGGGHPPA